MTSFPPWTEANNNNNMKPEFIDFFSKLKLM